MSKINFLVTLVLILGFGVLQAQPYEGYVITTKGDTLQGKIKLKFKILPNPLRKNEAYLYLFNEQDEKIKFLTEEIQGYALRWEERGELTHFRAKWRRGKREFLSADVDGMIKLYKFNRGTPWRDPQSGIKYTDLKKTIFYLEKDDNNKLLHLTKKNYQKILKDLLSDCPFLIQKIGKKNFKYPNMEAMIYYYNNLCKRIEG